MKDFLKHNWLYLLLYLLLLAFIGNVLLHHGKVQIHKVINAQVGNHTLDVFFKYATHLGDGLFAVIIAVFLAFYSIRKALYILLAYAGSGIVSYIMKTWIYTNSGRPFFVFQFFVREELKQVDGVEMLTHNTFPSGHALSAFVLFFCLIFMTKNHALKFLYLVLACIAAYSRTYLSQHWLVDIYVGSIIGTSFAVLLYFVFYKNAKFQRLDRSILQLFQKNKTGV